MIVALKSLVVITSWRCYRGSDVWSVSMLAPVLYLPQRWCLDRQQDFGGDDVETQKDVCWMHPAIYKSAHAISAIVGDRPTD
ncbi:hypothetical protein ACIBEJ_19995 [Nonomuraea sp. NPDC050790]|uniref:hypothetical protein n=1 Tax=Nonomuraea sp. NPDC050790 TaxID=3364371 RepID=UPI003790E2B5